VGGSVATLFKILSQNLSGLTEEYRSQCSQSSGWDLPNTNQTYQLFNHYIRCSVFLHNSISMLIAVLLYNIYSSPDIY
jgi:hypothetical protein